MSIKSKLISSSTKAWNSPTLMTWGNMLSQSTKLLVLTPLILINYNVDEIAFWYLLLTLNSLVIVVDFGFYPTYSRIVSYAYSGLGEVKDISKVDQKVNFREPEWGFMKRIYGTLNTTYFLMTIFVAVVVLISTIYSVSIIINRTSQQWLLWSAYGVFLLSTVFAFLARRSDTIIIGTNHVALINRWNIFNNVFNSLCSILIVYYGLSVFWLAANQLLFSVLLLIRNFYIEQYICDGKFKEFKLFSFDKEIFNWIWAPAWKSGVLVLASTGITQITGILYSNWSTSAELAAYLITLKLVTTVSQFSQAPFYSKLPVFSGLRVNHKLQKLSDSSAIAMYKAFWVFALGMACLFYFGDFLLMAIGANSNLESSPFIILMAFVWFFERQHAMHAQIYVTTNDVPFYKSAIVTGLISIASIYIFLPIFGVWAFPMSQGISNLAINNWWNVRLSLDSIEQNFYTYFKKSALEPFVFLLLTSSICLILYYCDLTL